MLVATSVATDTRVLREAGALADAGHEVHVIGKDVPEGFAPEHPGVTVSSGGARSPLRPGRGASEGSLSARGSLPVHLRLARWALLPQHRNAAFGSWSAAAVADARGRRFDAVHAHDFTALEAADTLAREAGVPLVYDSHELWAGRPREYRPTPLQDRREARREREIGARAAAVITVGDGVADALRTRYGWDHVVVVRNTFPDPGPDAPAAVSPPVGAVYAGRIAAYRDLEAIAAAAPAAPGHARRARGRHLARPARRGARRGPGARARAGRGGHRAAAGRRPRAGDQLGQVGQPPARPAEQAVPRRARGRPGRGHRRPRAAPRRAPSTVWARCTGPATPPTSPARCARWSPSIRRTPPGSCPHGPRCRGRPTPRPSSPSTPRSVERPRPEPPVDFVRSHLPSPLARCGARRIT